VWPIDPTITAEARQMNGSSEQRQSTADDQDHTRQGSPELALIVYGFLAAFAYLFAAISGAI
jgi:hypothetical protein